jgi:UDP-N-acetyl-D-mannosaminouronate:lipid I N-acetyl-D-mannosaminouronosyltransferase
VNFKLINGVKTYAPSSRLELMEFALKNKSILVAVNAEKILHATDETRSIINRNVGYPDGIGAVMGLKRKGLKNSTKIPGCELWLDLIKKYEKTKTFYFVGGKEKTINETVSKLKKEYPELNILGHRNGYLRSDTEKQDLIQDILNKKPDVVFVAMGSPKQEFLMEEISKVHPAAYQGLGGSFDVYTGNVKRAPKWWVDNNLEWAYRLKKEPRRIKRQIYLVNYLVLLLLNRF